MKNNDTQQVKCPECHKIFRITSAHLAVAHGQIVCIDCKAKFDGQQHLLENELKKAVLGQTVVKKTGWLRRFLAFGLALLWAVLLLAQYYWFYQPALLLQNAQIRPVLTQGCQWVNQYAVPCHLPLTRDTRQIAVKKRYLDVHSHQADASTLHVVFENTAAFAQAYPYVSLSFMDENKNIIALRRFSPVYYLQDEAALSKEFAPNEQVHMKLDLRNVVAKMHTYSFQIDFL